MNMEMTSLLSSARRGSVPMLLPRTKYPPSWKNTVPQSPGFMGLPMRWRWQNSSPHLIRLLYASIRRRFAGFYRGLSEERGTLHLKLVLFLFALPNPLCLLKGPILRWHIHSGLFKQLGDGAYLDTRVCLIPSG